MNIQIIQNQISKKKQSIPYYGTNNDLNNVITDYDHFPYTRFYRGSYMSPDPIVSEREAGYRPVKNECYASNGCYTKPIYPKHCFQSGCSVVYPCNVTDSKYDKNIQLNNECILEYR